MAKFFKIPWATSGDKTATPNDTQVDGSASYEQGWTFDYQRDLASDPDAKPIDREQMNGVLADITEALNQYQTQSIPDFITTADNGGSPYSYAKGVRVRFDPGAGYAFYESLVAANTSDPTDATKWLPLANTNLPGSVVQSVYAENTTANVALTAVSGTYPALAGGTLLATAVITPTIATDYLVFTANVPVVASASRIRMYAYIIEAGGTNVIASATLRQGDTANLSWQSADFILRKKIVAGGTAARTFRLYAGYNDGTGFISCVGNSEGGESTLTIDQVRG